MTTKHRFITILNSIALGACFAYAGPNAHAQSYSLTDLGVLSGKAVNISTPAAINEQAQVAGTSGAAPSNESAFRYDAKSQSMVNLATKPAGTISRGFGINASGQVVGDSNFGDSGSFTSLVSVLRAAIFSDGSIADLGVLKGAGDYSRANDINASGQVVGFAGSTLDSSSSRAFVWSSSTGMLDLGTLGGAYAQASAINDSGFVTGTSETADGKLGATHAFIYQVSSPTSGFVQPMSDLGTLGGDSSYGTSINVNNHVVGNSNVNNLDNRVHAFLHDGAKMLDLGSLGGKSADDDQSFAMGVNATDQVVGYSYLSTNDPLPLRSGGVSMNGPVTVPRQAAFIYSKGVMVNLNGLIGDAAKDYSLISATAINDQGQVAAIALNSGTNEYHAVLLTPEVASVSVSVTNAVNIITAKYDATKSLLLVEATITDESSSGLLPIVQVYSADGKLIGTLSPDKNKDGIYSGLFTISDRPFEITVVSNNGGSAASKITDGVINTFGRSQRKVARVTSVKR